MTERVTLPTITHVWEGHTERKIGRWVRDHMYLVQRAKMDWYDMMQEAYIVWMKCADMYSHIENPKHFYSLYLSAVNRHTLDCIKFHSRKKRGGDLMTFSMEVKSSYREGDTFEDELTARDTIAAAEFRVLVEDAPEGVRELIYQVLIENKKVTCRKYKGRRETINQALSRVAGVPIDNLRELFVDWYGEDPTLASSH